MLTEKEQEWLTVRKKACARCSVPGKCSQDQRNHCYAVGYPLWGSTVVTFEAFRDAAEFEARVSRRLAVMLKDALREGVDTCDASMRRLQRLAERMEGYARKLDMEMEKEKYKC